MVSNLSWAIIFNYDRNLWKIWYLFQHNCECIIWQGHTSLDLGSVHTVICGACLRIGKIKCMNWEVIKPSEPGLNEWGSSVYDNHKVVRNGKQVKKKRFKFSRYTEAVVLQNEPLKSMSRICNACLYKRMAHEQLQLCLLRLLLYYCDQFSCGPISPYLRDV